MRNSMKKRIMSFLLAFSIMVSMFMNVPLRAEASTISEGKCGDNLTWKLDSDGVLTISGTGEMDGYFFDAPWCNLEFKEINVTEGVTSIGTLAFAYSSFEEITLPNSLTTISADAFEFCSEIAKIYIPKNVTTIGSGAFYRASCNIEVDKNNENYASIDGLLYNKECTELLHYPYGKTDSKYNMPATIEKITYNQFDGNESLTEVILSEKIDVLPEYAFSGCRRLHEVYIPSGVKLSEEQPFLECDALRDIYYGGSKSDWENFIQNSGGLEKVDYNNVIANATIHYNAVVDHTTGYLIGGECGENLTWNIDSEGVLTVSGTGVISGSPWRSFENYDPSNIKKLVIREGVTGVGANAFYYCSNLTDIQFPKSLKTIGASAFQYCKKLTSVELPDGLTSIESWTFMECEELTEVNFPESLTSIESYAFGHCSKLDKLILGKNVSFIAEDAFEGACNISQITVNEENENYTAVDGVLFNKDCSELILYPGNKDAKSYTVPDSVKIIHNDAWVYCGNLEVLNIPASVSVMYIDPDSKEYGSASPFRNIKAINVDKDNKQYASIDGVLYNKDLTTLLYYPVCKDATSYVMPDSVIYMSREAFYNSQNLTTIILSKNLNTISRYAFENAGNLKEIYIPSSLQYISWWYGSPFDGTALTDIYYEGSETLWNQLLRLKQWGDYFDDEDVLANATVHYLSTYDTETGFGTQDPLPFTDINKDTNSSWYYRAVTNVYKKNLMTGMNPTNFGAYEEISRAQFAVILYRMDGEPDAVYKGEFPDVSETDATKWYISAVAWANANKLITGYTHNKHFGAADSITREQLATILYRYAVMKGYDVSKTADLTSYKDGSSVSGFAKEALAWAVGSGILTGKDNQTRLDPQGTAKRSECAVMLNRFLEKYQAE